MSKMDNRDMHRTLYKNARFEAVSTTERSRRRTEISRKIGRERDIQQRRKIEKSPCPQPVAKTELTRREKLLRWRAEKEAILLAEKAKKKPPFKVGAFQGLVVKDIPLLQPPKSVKKAPKEQLMTTKKQTAATVALAALSASSNKRITRSQVKLAEQTTQIPQTRSKIVEMSTHHKTGSKAAVAQKPSSQVSFAPANHVFKPPINLTFPVTPDLMKRTKKPTSSQSKTMSYLVAVSGVKPLKTSNLLENISENSQGFPTIKASEDNVPVDNLTKRTPAKRRSTRLATPKAASVSVDCGESPTKQAKKDSEEKSSRKAEDNKENQEGRENEFVARKISRMSIHSPTRIDVNSTPEPAGEGTLPAQFSPFIVTGRGADRHKNRRSRGNDLVDVTSVDHKKAKQVKHFRSLLEDETNRLLKLCDKWENFKNHATEDIPSDVQDMILAAVGQARLLTKDKFQQFRNLVDKFERGTSEEKITADDLTGFWEMVQVTVNSSNNQFKKLSDLQSNGWKEEVKVVRKRATAVLGPRTNNVRPEALEQSKARIREAMAAARKLKRERMEQSRNKSSEKTFDGGFFKIESPKRKTENVVPAQKDPSTPAKPLRKSLLQTVLTNSANRMVKSPSVSKVSDRIRVSLVGRRTSLSVPDEEPMFVSPPPSLTAVPAKSILKSANKSAKRHTVVFNRAGEGSETESSVSRQTPRRSLRFNVGTKFNDSPL